MCGEMRTRTIVTVLAAVQALLVVAQYAYWSFENQINNSIVLQRVASRVMEQRARCGAYPSLLDRRDWLAREAGDPADTVDLTRDWWGREMLYVNNMTGFVLVSYGWGGRPDRLDYVRWAAIGATTVTDTCFIPWRDTVFTDQGCVACCLK